MAKLKTLKRHLMAAYGMSSEEYRTRWNLPSTYPVTAPNYSERRSKIAAASGLGRKRGSMAPVSMRVQRVKGGVSEKGGQGRRRKTPPLIPADASGGKEATLQGLL